jgi:diguanylate cyclase (GGDEF)-like protein
LKIVNDSLGHDIGDKLIRLISRRLKRAVVEPHIVSRLSGDEFVILLKNFDAHSVKSQADKILRIVREEIIIEMNHLYVAASIGIANYPEDGTDAYTLLKHSDTAMYEAKDHGGNCYRYYHTVLTEKVQEQMTLAREFRVALRNKEFEVYYQPQIDMRTEKIIGLEALIRWNHPKEGFLTPARFLPAIEKANLLHRLDKWVMNNAMKDVVKWHDEGLNPGKLSLNVSMSELETDNWEDKLLRIMKRFEFQPNWLELEVTETEIMTDSTKVISLLAGLRKQNISIAIDDFGTGYSSLAQLKDLPIDKLKIDRTFIIDLPSGKDAMLMANTIIFLAQSMGISVIAEGIETKEQAKYLLENGCYLAQGYYFAKPMKAEDIRKRLEEQKTT